MIVPTIHMNGSSKKTLIANLATAHESLLKADADLHRCAPNGRDYYVQEGNALSKATEEHYERIMRVRSVIDELEKLMIAIDKQ